MENPATSKAKPTMKTSTTKKRRRADTDDSASPTKKARPQPRERKPRKKTAAVKQDTLECTICVESKSIYRNFPSLPTCSHNATVCSDCFQKHFVTRIDENRRKGWNACTCPLCGEKVEPKDAQSVLPRHISRDLVTMIKNVEEQTDQDWIWCPGPDCGRGQLHTSRKATKVACKHCDFEICSKHQTKWHQGLTCDEFDEAGDHDASIAKSVREIERTTKPCPHCKTRIKKEGGCNYMTCTGCQKSWLWNTVAFDGEQLPSIAEVRGGSGGHEPLNGEERQVVEQVMRFENGVAETPQAEVNIGNRLGVEQRPADEWIPVLGQELEAIRATARTQDPRRHPRPRNAPVAPRRPTTNGVRVPRRPAGPGFAARRRRPRPIPNLREAITIESDSSESSSDESRDGLRRNIQQRARTGQGGPHIHPIVIDLTQEVHVIDLTGDD